MASATKSHYNTDAVGAAISVIVELFGSLGEFRQCIAVVGGFVPFLALRGAAEQHVGSLDVDLALDFAHISDDTYTTLLRALAEAGYRQDAAQPFRFFKMVALRDEPAIQVEVNLLAGEYGGTGRTHRTQVAQDVRARKARGADLVFKHCAEIRLEERLPNGAIDTVTVTVADMVAFLAMKGMALHDRRSAKDCYDCYYCVRHHPGGVSSLVAACRPHVAERLVREGLSKMRTAFMSPEHWGPVAVADFLELGDPEERETTTRDAYERMTLLLDELGIEPWGSGPE